MIRYGFGCRQGHRWDDFRTVADRDAPASCPTCGESGHRDVAAAGVAGQVSAESPARYQAWFNSSKVQAGLRSGELEIPSKSADVRHL